MMTGYLARDRLDELLAALVAAGYRCIGPQLHDGAILYRDLASASALPQGFGDRQEPARYRLEAQGHARQFAWANGPQALKPYLFAAEEPLWRFERVFRGDFRFSAVNADTKPLALISVRAFHHAPLRP